MQARRRPLQGRLCSTAEVEVEEWQEDPRLEEAGVLGEGGPVEAMRIPRLRLREQRTAEGVAVAVVVVTPTEWVRQEGRALWSWRIQPRNLSSLFPQLQTQG